MAQSTYFSCHRVFRYRLRHRITILERNRRGFHCSQPALTPSSIDNKTSSRSAGSLYIDSTIPQLSQLNAATHFFKTNRPRKGWVANEWRKQAQAQAQASSQSPPSSQLTPEVIFLGRSNTGKSSLLNALLAAQELCRVGPKQGKTTTMHAWALSPMHPRTGKPLLAPNGNGAIDTKMMVLDMPGYGYGSRADWGVEITKYLKNRKQLRRAFVLLNPVHGIKDADEQILGLLRMHGISHQIIACKCDSVKPKDLPGMLADLRENIKAGERKMGAIALALDDILAVGGLGDGKMNNRIKEKDYLGVEEVRWATLRAVGLERYAVHILAEHLKKEAKSAIPFPTAPTPKVILQLPKEAAGQQTGISVP